MAKPTLPHPELLPSGQILLAQVDGEKRRMTTIAPTHDAYAQWLIRVQGDRRRDARRSVTYGIWVFMAQYALLQLVVAVVAFIVLVIAFPDTFH